MTPRHAKKNSELELTPEQTAIQVQAGEWTERARSLVITTPESYIAAGTMLNNVKALLAEADSVFDGAIKKAHEAHKAMIAAKGKVTEPLLKAKDLLNRGIWNYQEAQEAARRAEEDRLRKLALEQARAEAEAEAKALEAQGDQAAASFVRTAPVQAQVVTVPSLVPKIAGVSKRRTLHRARVVDFVSLVAWCIEAPADRLVYLLPNETALRQRAEQTQGSAEIPGVEFYNPS